MTAPEKQQIGLALSGGGFRASLFHLGGLWRLNEMGKLAEVGAISARVGRGAGGRGPGNSLEEADL